MNLDIAIIGCTHGMHGAIDIPDADVLIHTGDVSMHSTENDVLKFGAWFGKQPHEHKLCIAGNHDRFMSRRNLPDNVTYLQDSKTEIDGMVFYGSPWTPMFFDWYWMKERGEDIAERWRLMPDETDVLITHGPAHGCLDRTIEGVHAGCERLSSELERVMPHLHCFSHIHEAAGVCDLTSVADMMKPFNQPLISVNASIVTRGMKPINKPVLISV